MATDATGTPTTNFAIPKIDPTNDAPSGLGMNAMMDSIDGLFGQAPMSGSIAGIAVGSVPVWDGSSWVKPTGTPTGSKFLRDDGAWASPSGLTVGYGTSLPGSPADGQEYLLVDSVTAPTYVWRFRYNSGRTSDSYKWEFIGGSPAVVIVTTEESTSSTSYTTLTTAGPSFTLPVAGNWDVSISATLNDGTSGGYNYGGISYAVGGTAANDAWAFLGVNRTNSLDHKAGGTRVYRHMALAASTSLSARYRTRADPVKFSFRTLTVLPVAVI